MAKFDLANQAVLITGGLGGIGEYVLRTLAKAGATLLITDRRSPDDASGMLAQWGLEKAWYRSLDVTDPTAMETVLSEAFEYRKDLATVIGHAGGCGLHPFSNTPREHFAALFDFNFFSQTYLARAVLRHWVAAGIKGHLIFTSSYVAQIPSVQIPAYASAKAALENFGKCLALEYGGQGIRVNMLAPGNVAAGASLKVYETDVAYREFCDHASPLGHRNTPQGIADAMLFLVSPMALEMNGCVLKVDQGVSIPKIW